MGFEGFATCPRCRLRRGSRPRDGSSLAADRRLDDHLPAARAAPLAARSLQEPDDRGGQRPSAVLADATVAELSEDGAPGRVEWAGSSWGIGWLHSGVWPERSLRDVGPLTG